MPEFKVGDKVRTIKHTFAHSAPIGSEGIVFVVHDNPGITYSIIADVNGKHLSFRPDELELIDEPAGTWNEGVLEVIDFLSKQGFEDAAGLVGGEFLGIWPEPEPTPEPAYKVGDRLIVKDTFTVPERRGVIFTVSEVVEDHFFDKRDMLETPPFYYKDDENGGSYWEEFVEPLEYLPPSDLPVGAMIQFHMDNSNEFWVKLQDGSFVDSTGYRGNLSWATKDNVYDYEILYTPEEVK